KLAGSGVTPDRPRGLAQNQRNVLDAEATGGIRKAVELRQGGGHWLRLHWFAPLMHRIGAVVLRMLRYATGRNKGQQIHCGIVAPPYTPCARLCRHGCFSLMWTTP